MARALQLSDAERDHLFVVAGLLPPSPGEVPNVFSVAGTDLRIVAYTAASGSEAAAKLDFLRVSAIAAVRPAS